MDSVVSSDKIFSWSMINHDIDYSSNEALPSHVLYHIHSGCIQERRLSVNMIHAYVLDNTVKESETVEVRLRFLASSARIA